jgi:protocatechuate 3,4-dioxygenase alpha subunit
MKQTASQTVGPFYAIGLTRKPMNVLVSADTPGERIRVEGRIFDGDGRPVPDAMIEIWQANASGRYNNPEDKQEKPLDPDFMGWGRCGTDENGAYGFDTIRPGPVPGANGTVQAPHISVVVFARGMLTHAFTRIYFADQRENDSDAVLSSIKSTARRQTLIAPREENDGKTVYRFDVSLQGEKETVFFDM